MKDLDLDELHQAVNAMMDEPGQKPKKSGTKSHKTTGAAKEHPKPDVVKKSVPRAQPSSVDSGSEDDTPQQIEVKRSAPRLTIPPRHRGAAMDIVQPAKPVQPPAARPSRVAPALQPSKKVEPQPPTPALVQAPPAAPKPPEHIGDLDDDLLASLDLQPTPSPKQNPTILDKEHDESWPDPLDFHDFKDTAKAEAPADASAASKPAPIPDAPTLSSAPSDVEPQTNPEPPTTQESITATPFLTTKVQKRPLGAFNAEPPQPKPQEPEFKPRAELDGDASMQEPLDQKELSPEVMAVEQSEPLHAPSPVTPQTPPAPEQDLQSARQMAIPPQYQQTVKSSNQDARPVFDTQDYHTPLIPAHVPHHGKGKAIGIAILLLVMLGVAAVIAYFVMVIGVNPLDLL